MNTSVNFSISLTAQPAEVDALVAAIRRTFGQEQAIDPAQAVAVSIAPVTVTHVAPGASGLQLADGDSDDAGVEAQENKAEPLVEGCDESIRDAQNWPWCSQIHASTKTTTGDGIWRNRPKVEDAERIRIEALIVANYGVSPRTGTAPAPQATAQQTAPPAPPATGAPVPPPPPAPAAPTTPTERPEVVQFLSWLADERVRQPRLNDDAWLAGIFQHYGAVDANGGGSVAAVGSMPDDNRVALETYLRDTAAAMARGEA